jgi:uncharacterized protein with PIN domain
MPVTFRPDSARNVNNLDAPRFVADAMVGKLARWLRILGVDVIYDVSLDDHELLALARMEKRVLLTRDNPLAAGAGEPRRLLIESDDFRRQLIQVVTTFQLDFRRALFTRCVDCNTPLESVPRGEARGKVPPYVFSTQEQFKRCPQCDKILWGGTHRQHMQRVLSLIFAELEKG